MQQPDYRTLAAKIHHLSDGERSDVKHAFEFAVQAHASQTREDGSPYVLHVIAVAETVALWKADRDTIIAALLHDVIEDTSIHKEEITEKFGRRVALLVESITKFTEADFSPDLPLDRKIETLRKLFDVMRYDMRSVIIKLADRLHNIETIDALPTLERQRRFADETLSVYIKIALHLGMRDVRHVFAEHCVPIAFDDGIAALAERDRSFEAAQSLKPLMTKSLHATESAQSLLSVEVQSRNLLTYYERRRAKGGSAASYDAFIVSICVRTEDDCYKLLRILHTLYRPVTGQFRDYIAAPSDAGYQSLHTIVTLPDGRVVEVRIRTPEMYEQAKHGITLWLFQGQRVPPNFSWLQRTEGIDLKTRDSSAAFWEALQADVLSETISVMIDHQRYSLPKGSTVLDAAYISANDRAGSLISGVVRGKAESFGTQLHDDDDVHLVFDQSSHVSFEWLQMVATQHARMFIVDVLKKTGRRQKIALGANLLQKELDHYGKGVLTSLPKHSQQNLATHFRRETFDDVLSMIGEGVIRARDVVFYLYPDHRRKFLPFRIGKYFFRLRISGSENPGQDVLALLHGVIRSNEVTLSSINMKSSKRNSIVDILVVGHCPDRLQFADFVDALERQEWTSKVQTLISHGQKFLLIASSILALVAIALDVLLFPTYQHIIEKWPYIPVFIFQVVPLLPILAVNYYLLRLLRYYVVRMRSEQWFLGLGLLLNLIGLVLIVLRLSFLSTPPGTLFPLIAVFTTSLLYMGYRFYQADSLFLLFETSRPPIVRRPSRDVLWQKIWGYLIRFFAVTIWGLIPIYIRYTPVSTLPPIFRIFLMGLGMIIPFTIIHVFRSIFQHRTISFRLPYTYAFWMIVIGQIAFAYLQHKSLLYTSGTNFLLFNNFAPVIGLFVSVLFWRQEIAYLRRPETMVWIFLLAVLATLGSSLLVYTTSTNTSSTAVTIFGDLLAMISMVFDVILTLGQIKYIQQYSKTDGVLLNIHLAFYFLLSTAPIVFFGTLYGFMPTLTLTSSTWYLGGILGFIFGTALIFNYESFKRIDGYIAYMLFNLSVVFTFTFEAFIAHSISPTPILLLSAFLIIGASLFAELINTRCEKLS